MATNNTDSTNDVVVTDESHPQPRPVDTTGNKKVSLNQRPPVEQVPIRTWFAYLTFGQFKLQYTYIFEQASQCIRSRRRVMRWNWGNSDPIDFGISIEETASPYETQQLPHSMTMSANIRRTWGLNLRTPWFGIGSASTVRADIVIRPIYIVLGVFTRSRADPHERIVIVPKPDQLFWRLRWAAFRLRGWRGSFLSLRHVQGFRLYKCNGGTGAHERVDLDSQGAADLQQLFDTYQRWWYAPSYLAHAWANWIYQELNCRSHNLREPDAYSIELVLAWSAVRITIVVLLPVLLSLAVGIWLNSKDWSDLATIQTAWGTASYIVTTGGLIVALLAIISSIADK